MKPFDVCVVGHTTRDWIRRDGAERCATGGVVYYAALTLQQLGYRVAVITRLNASDRDELLGELRAAGIAVYCRDSAETSVFYCVYSTASPDERVLTVGPVAEAFTPADLEGVSAHWFYLGPLTNRDMSPGFIRAAAARGDVALDAQGLVRQVEAGAIRAVRPPKISALLQNVSLLKVDAYEAATLTEERDLKVSARRLSELGAGEVVLTCGSRGSLVFDGSEFHVVDAVDGEVVDPMGCGDTYLAAYLARRLASDGPASAGRFAAAAAELTLEREGAFRATEALVRGRMA